MDKNIAPEGLKHYNVTITCSVTFEDTFAYSKEEAEELASNSFYGGGGQGSMDLNDAEFEAIEMSNDRRKVQQLYQEIWDEEPIAEPRG